jgi:hypothetical protein
LRWITTGFSRGAEREAGLNVEVLWLLGWFDPDRKSNADLRKHKGDALGVRVLCRVLCRMGFLGSSPARKGFGAWRPDLGTAVVLGRLQSESAEDLA